MKKQFSYPITLLLIIFLASFSSIPKGKSCKFLPKEMKRLKAVTYVPEGVFNGQKMDAFFMYFNEVSNFDYLEFLSHVKRKQNKALLNQVQIDTSLWMNIDIDGNYLYSENYHKKWHYPVVNVSKESAEFYCKWLSDIWNTNQDKYIVEFKLPTKDQWEYAALGGKNPEESPYPWGGPFCKSSSKCMNSGNKYLAQYKTLGLKRGPTGVNSFCANEFGLRNMSGNVAEMVSDTEIVKGGSWNDTKSDVKIKSEQKLEQSPLVGFRPIMTFKEK